MHDLLANVSLGLATALQPAHLMYCVIGVVLGTLLGIIPGIGALVSITLLFPITFHLEPTSALIMLAGIFYGTTYGGSTASILLNVPGTPNAAVACLDGYPMAKQGRGGVALLMTTVASFVGASIGILLLMLFAPGIAEWGLMFGSQEYFALMVLGLIAASTIAGDSPIKGIAMVVLGILLGLVGADMYSGVMRFTFGEMRLFDGLSLVALAMGLFGVAEIIASVRTAKVQRAGAMNVSLRAMIPTRDDVRRSGLPMLRGASVGSFFGAVPGAGSLIAAFMAYALERKVAREPQRFGNGAIEGLVAPETANNAADQTAFIPTLTLGIPGSPTMAIMLGVLMIHGIAPGPSLIIEQSQLFWGLIMSFWIGNILLVILNIPLIGIWIRVLTIPYHLLYPAVVTFICVGIYSVNRDSFQVWVVLFFGALGYLLRVFGYSAAPLILGFVLGPMMEQHLRRALLLSQGSFMTFIERPISAGIMAVTGLLLAWAVWSWLAQLWKGERPATAPQDL